MNKTSKELDFSGTTADDTTDFFHSTELTESIPKGKCKINVSELQENMQLVIEENEALRTGMHEILDSIRDQDGDFSLILMVLVRCTVCFPSFHTKKKQKKNNKLSYEFLLFINNTRTCC